MNKTKKIYFLISVFVFSAISLVAVSQQVLAAHGRATVSWVAPTTDEGAGDLTGLSGYRVYYSSTAIDCTAWDAATSAARLADAGTLLPATSRTVSDGATLSYTFNNTELLTPGTTYNFAVVAYDNADDINLSKCAVTEGAATFVSKAVTYAADFDNNHAVNGNDFTTFADDYGESICGPVNKTDINNDCRVNINDFTLLADDYGQSF
ncbi:MAG TPA: hypothetical protein P5323_01145 [Candidatus Moranbacteria bacterium]|nr:hypothetical protein [Candidatus Moranbacteria bacterium]HRY27719.1 hypothetical protein [Candidatus Moranbacteria bacterium]HSA08516.1 hypothetical protein [Candidatus Moranbacteria bacterium]